MCSSSRHPQTHSAELKTWPTLTTDHSNSPHACTLDCVVYLSKMASGSKERRALRSADTIHQDQSLESSPGPVTSDIVPATLEAQKGPTNPTPFSPQKSGPKELRELWAKESFPRLRSRSGGKVAGICKKYRAKKRATRSTASTTAGNQTSFVRVGQVSTSET